MTLVSGPPVRIQLCGPIVVERDGERLDGRLPGRQGRLLFAYLVLNRHRVAGRDELAEQPPARLAYLWYLGRDRADATEVEIRFLARGASASRVEIEHRGWERLGPAGGPWRDRNQAGWQSLLSHFVTATEKEEH